MQNQIKNQKIVFLGTHGQMNIGDELLLETFLRQLGTSNRYYVNSYDPQYTAAQLSSTFQVEVFNTAKERGKLLHYLRECDLLFFGGGSIIKELYASVGRGPYATLLMVLAIVTFTRQVARKPTVMSNIGVGPLHTPRGKRLASWILRQVNVLSVRDRQSYLTCLELGLSPDRVQQVPDAVFVNPPQVFVGEAVAQNVAQTVAQTVAQPRGNLSAALALAGAGAGPAYPLDDRPLKVALNLNYDIENPANWETFQENLACGLRRLHAQRPIEVHTLPMQSHFKTMHDARVLADFRERIPELEVRLHEPQTHKEAAAIIDQCDMLLSERLHALVMAAILGKPFVALAYDVKVAELVAGLEMEAFSININQPFDPNCIVELMNRAMGEVESVREHLLERSSALRGELDAYFNALALRLTTSKGG
jgi:polysaccharide pyruvyl transferase WcaK-like protein